MQFHLHANKTATETDAVIVFAGKEKEEWRIASDVSPGEGVLERLKQLADAEEFSGSAKSVLSFTSFEKNSRRYFLVGLGDITKLTYRVWQEAIAGAVRRCRTSSVSSLSLSIPSEVREKLGQGSCMRAVVEACKLAGYRFEKYLTHSEKKKKKRGIDTVHIIGMSAGDDVQKSVTEGEIRADAVLFARDLINESPSVTTPAYLGTVAMKLAEDSDKVVAEVFGPEEIEAFGMGGLMAISRGSVAEPRFIKLTYDVGAKHTVCIIGKGITFDTGGLSLKGADHMETMKLDMAGAAAILAVFSALPTIKPGVNVVGLIPSTENMPGPNAVKPGDVVTAMNGKTIEILNTDAEGRVVLADALSYAGAKVKPDVIVDLATLTGACMVALGPDVAGLFSNTKDVARAVKKAAGDAGERVWPLPLVPEYNEMLKSSVADIKNIGIRYGGAITGALFLEAFVPEATPWVHLDIAGPSFTEKDTPLAARGGTGFGVRLLLEYIETFSRS